MTSQYAGNGKKEQKPKEKLTHWDRCGKCPTCLKSKASSVAKTVPRAIPKKNTVRPARRPQNRSLSGPQQRTQQGRDTRLAVPMPPRSGGGVQHRQAAMPKHYQMPDQKRMQHPYWHESHQWEKHIANPAQEELGELMQAILDPQHSFGVRWATAFTGEPTAVSSPYSLQQVLFAPVAEPDPAWGMFGFRNPAVTSVVRAFSTDPMVYAMYGRNTNDTTSLPSTTWVMQNTESEAPVNIVYGSPTDDFQPHGDIWFAGAVPDLEGSRFFWCDGGEQWTFNMGTPVATTVTATLSKWLPQGYTQVSHQVTTASAISHAASLTTVGFGYYALSIVTAAALDTTINSLLIHNGTPFSDDRPCANKDREYMKRLYAERQLKGGRLESLREVNARLCAEDKIPFAFQPMVLEPEYIWGHQHAPQLGAFVNALKAYRVIGVSAMYTNAAPEIYREGLITGVQLPIGDHWVNTKENLTNLASLAGAQQLDAATGMYGCILPREYRDFDWQAPFDYDKVGNVVGSHWDVTNTQSFTAYYAAMNTDLGRNGVLTVAVAFELMSLTTWFQNAPPRASPELCERAIVEATSAPNFKENPLHAKAIAKHIASAIKTVGNLASTYGPLVKQVASLF